MKQDFLDFLDEHLAEIVLDHLNTWKDRYWLKTIESIQDDIRCNYDFSADFDSIESRLNRELTDDEKEYYIQEFVDFVPAHFE